MIVPLKFQVYAALNFPTTSLASQPRELMLQILEDARQEVFAADAVCHRQQNSPKHYEHVTTATAARKHAFIKWQRAVRLWNIWKGLQPL